MKDEGSLIPVSKLSNTGTGGVRRTLTIQEVVRQLAQLHAAQRGDHREQKQHEDRLQSHIQMVRSKHIITPCENACELPKTRNREHDWIKIGRF